VRVIKVAAQESRRHGIAGRPRLRGKNVLRAFCPQVPLSFPALPGSGLLACVPMSVTFMKRTLNQNVGVFLDSMIVKV